MHLIVVTSLLPSPNHATRLEFATSSLAQGQSVVSDPKIFLLQSQCFGSSSSPMHHTDFLIVLCAVSIALRKHKTPNVRAQKKGWNSHLTIEDQHFVQLNVRPFYCYPLSSPRFGPWNTITPDAWSWLAVTSWCFEGRVDRRWISKPLCICLSVSQVEAVQSGSTKLCSRAQQSRVTQSYELQGPNIKSTQMTVWWKLNPCSKPYPLFFLYFRIIENHIYPFCFTVCAFSHPFNKNLWIN